ncbi:MAG TPA: hypothetical protein VFK47_06390, partial [Ktedonobacteraceae bacterium]|nr:hypothetical protein [Ktedonobacteraceae bacterium]
SPSTFNLPRICSPGAGRRFCLKHATFYVLQLGNAFPIASTFGSAIVTAFLAALSTARSAAD